MIYMTSSINCPLNPYNTILISIHYCHPPPQLTAPLTHTIPLLSLSTTAPLTHTIPLSIHYCPPTSINCPLNPYNTTLISIHYCRPPPQLTTPLTHTIPLLSPSTTATPPPQLTAPLTHTIPLLSPSATAAPHLPPTSINLVQGADISGVCWRRPWR